MTEIKLKIIKDEPRVSHIVIAKNTNNLEKAIANIINKYKDDFTEFGQLHFKNATVENTVGAVNIKKIYYLNEHQSTLLLTYLKNSVIVRKFKIALVKEFFKMRNFIQNRFTKNEINIDLSDSKVRDAFFIAFDGKCYYTNEILNKNNFEIRHILPKNMGGRDSLNNLTVSKSNLQIPTNYNPEYITHHQNIITKKFAPRIEAILNLIDEINNILDKNIRQYLYESSKTEILH